MMCTKCKQVRPLSSFHKNRKRQNGHESVCKMCRKERAAKDYIKNWFRQTYRLKKSWCFLRAIPFNLTPEYLEEIWTESCPITKHPFVRGNKTHPDCPALDRKVPRLGYVKGNVCFISARMNRIKMDATAKELRQIADWLDQT